MANLNKVLLMGNLTRDIRMSYLPSNTAVADLGMAINRTWVGQDGQKHDETTFVDLAMFGKRAEVLGKYLKKGDPLFVEGRLRYETWDDKQSGQKRNKLKVMIEDFQFLGRGGGGGQARDDGSPREQAPSPQAPQVAPPEQQAPPDDPAGNADEGAGDDIPF